MARLPLTEQEVSATKVVIKFGKVGLTEEQFWQLCRDNGDLQMELSAQKELIIMPPVGLKTGWRENILTTRLTSPVSKICIGACPTSRKFPN